MLMVKENETERGHAAGSPHCAEMPYVFGRVDKGERNPFFDYHWVGKDYDFMELIQGYWYNFCKNGDPNGEGLPVWKAYTDDFDINELGNDTHMITEPDKLAKYAYYYNKLKNSESVAPMRLAVSRRYRHSKGQYSKEPARHRAGSFKVIIFRKTACRFRASAPQTPQAYIRAAPRETRICGAASRGRCAARGTARGRGRASQSQSLCGRAAPPLRQAEALRPF